MKIEKEIEKAEESKQDIAKLNFSDNYDYIMSGDGWNKAGYNYGVVIIDTRSKEIVGWREIAYKNAGIGTSENNENMYIKQANETLNFYSDLEEGIDIGRICRSMGTPRTIKSDPEFTKEWIQNMIDNERSSYLSIKRLNKLQQVEEKQDILYPSGLSLSEAIDYMKTSELMGKASADALFKTK